MIDPILRSLMLIIAATALIAVNLFAVRSIGRIWFDRGATIMPFKVVGADQVLGPAMASLLQARLREIQRQLQQVQLGFVQSEASSPACPAPPQPVGAGDQHEDGKPSAPLPVIRLVSAPVPTALFEPLDLTMSVGGVDVGSILGWMQRTVVRPRVVQFTVSFSNGEAIVAGDLAPLTGRKGGVWLETKQVSPPQIADLLAHQLIATSSNDDNLAALVPENFQKLTRTLGTIADLNRRAAQGASVRKEFAEQLPDLVALTRAAPRWLDLLYFAASVAESAGDNSQALIIYQRLLIELSRTGANPGRSASITSAEVEAKLKDLRTAPPTGFFDDLAPRLLSVTGHFEVGSSEPVRMFGTVTASASNDIEFGIAFWSLHRGSLVPLLRKMRETDPQRFYGIIGDGAPDMDSLLACDPRAADDFVAKAVHDGHLHPEWQARFGRLGADPEFQKVQVLTLEPFFRRAIRQADQWGLRSEQALAQMFDMVFFRGALSRKAADKVTGRIAQIRADEHREPDERERMKLIAEAVAEISPPSIPLARMRALYFADPSKSNRPGLPSLEELGISQKAFRLM